MKNRLLALLCALALCATLPLPSTSAAGEVCFTALNDSLLSIGSDSMPLWSGGVLYVPYTAFDSGTTGISLGINCAQSKSSNTVSLFNLRQILVFDLNEGTCRNQQTQELLSGRAISRNGKTYLPVSTVCSFFGLSYSYNHTSYGYLVRIKSGDVVLDDTRFIDAASNLMSSRLREYNQSMAPAPTTPETPVIPPPAVLLPPVEEEPETTAVPTYLAFRCETGEAAGAILSALEHEGKLGLFFFPPEELSRQSDLVRRLVGTGHSVGLLVTGKTQEELQRQLEQGNRTLETVARTCTRTVYCREPQREALTAQGWVCWRERLDAVPTGKRSAAAHAASVVRQLDRRTGTAYLTLDDSQKTADALPALLRQLSAQQYTVGIPAETRL